MPSPVAHLAAGYALYRLFRDKIPVVWKSIPVPAALLVCLFMSMFPDMDSLAGFWTGDLGRYHNNLTHSFFAGTVAALAAAGAMRLATRTSFAAWFLPVLACCTAHVVMDYFTMGRGVMLFWPFTSERFLAPVQPFRGLQWAMGLWTIQHLWTVLNELCFVAALAILLTAFRLRRRNVETDGGTFH